MLTDAHCHPFDLIKVYPQAEEERVRLAVTAAASSCDLDEFSYNENLARKAAKDNACAILPCFAVHPQLPAFRIEKHGNLTQDELEKNIETLETLAKEGRLSAVGECGFDLYNKAYKDTEAVQEWLFNKHLEISNNYNLPVIIHARRAMHKIFASVKILSKCSAVVFHSWPGTPEEGQALFRRGVNAYFSFGNTILNGHKSAMRCCAVFPAQRLLTETDAPFQPRRGKSFSSWEDLPLIVNTAVSLRLEAQSNITNSKELETIIEKNFYDVFGIKK